MKNGSSRVERCACPLSGTMKGWAGTACNSILHQTTGRADKEIKWKVLVLFGKEWSWFGQKS